MLSTGLRVKSSADDAAGFAISERMRSQISGLNVAARNTQDGVSLLQTAEGALAQTNSMLQRMRELAIQASNDSLTSQDRQYLQLEVDELKDQIDRIANTTQFNRKRILDGSSGALWSSDDLSLKARINRGLVTVDEFGQKVNHEGNFRIEVSAEPGVPQVQKCSPFLPGSPVEETTVETIDLTFTRTVINTRTEIINEEEEIIVPIIFPLNDPEDADILEININTGQDVNGATSGKGWNYDSETGRLTITGDGRFRITGTGEATTNHVVVNPGVTTDVYLENVNINTDNGMYNYPPLDAAFLMDDAIVNMYLVGTNILQSGYHRAALEAPQGSTLNINSSAGDGALDGTLRAVGGPHGSGIGGCCNACFDVAASAGGNIIIRGGTIHATGGEDGAGIGGGWGRDAGTIEIYGGDVTAEGGIYAAGIGSSDYIGDEASATVIIGGGQVTATGGEYGGAGIGGGAYSGAGTIKIAPGLISGGAVVAQGTDGGQDIGAGIGYTGTYTDYDDTQTIDIPEPPAPSGYETQTITRQYEVTIEEETEEEVTIHEEVEIKKTVIGETRFGDFITQSSARGYSTGISSGESLISAGYQTLKITQGNGKTTEVTLYPGDTMSEVATKINNAIANDLGQGRYADYQTKFCTIESIPGTEVPVYTRSYLREDDGTLILDGNGNPIETGEQELAGYQPASWMFVRSAVPGKAGELYFSGDQDLLDALGLNTIQESSESTLTASVYDAHSGAAIAQNVKATGQEFVSLIPPEIDIEVDPMAGLAANWDENTKQFMMATHNVYTAMLHLKNNGTIFQTGANGGEDFMIDLGDTSSSALNLSRVNVLTRETASRSISILDRAISRIAAQRAKIGSYENALEHTMNNLTSSGSNLTASESRIRDLDMAYGMMDFVKLQILNQSGTSMLSQANQIPNSLLTLLQN